MAPASQKPRVYHPQGAKTSVRASKAAIREERIITVLFHSSVVIAVFVSIIIFTGAVAYFAKRFHGITPRWMFGLFD